MPLISAALLGSCGSLNDGAMNIIDSGGAGGMTSKGGSSGDAGQASMGDAGTSAGGTDSGEGGAGGADGGEGGAGGMPAVDCNNEVSDLAMMLPMDASTSDAENAVQGADCGGSDAGDGPDLVYSLTLEAAADVTIILQTPDYDGVLRIMTSSCDPASTVWKGCATDSDGQVELQVKDLPAGSYYLVVDGATDADFGDFTLDVATADPACPLSNLKIERIDSATPEATQLFNSGDCELDLSWFGTFHQDRETEGVLTELPEMPLAGRETVWLTDVNPPPDGQIYVGDAVGYSAETGGVVYLCRGACKPPAGDNVLDAFYFDGSTEFTFLSAVEFDGGATGVSVDDDALRDYFRLTYDGTFPTFQAAGDYTAAFLVEKFEDRSIADWTDAGQGALFTVGYDSPAGTVDTYALALSGGFATAYMGYRYDWSAPITPTYMSWRVRTANTLAYSGYLYGQDALAANLVSSYMSNTGTLFANGLITGVAANTWYQVILTNFDYVAKTVAVAVNGTTLGTASFPPAIVDMTTLHLFNYSNTTAWYDQIIVR